MRKKLNQYKILWLLMALFMTYLFVGYLYVPKIISQQLSRQLSEQLNMQAEMSAVKFNPLTFNIEINDLKITDSNQQTWYNSQLTGINFDPLNLIWGEWNFSDLNLVQPKINVMINEAGQVIIPALPEFPATPASDEPFNITIDQIRLTQARMNIQAGNIKKDFSLSIKSIELDHDPFSLADKDTHFEVKVTTENDESIVLNGYYNHVQQVINSQIQLIDWQAITLNQILPSELTIVNQAGTIQAKGSIDWPLSKKPLVNFTHIEIQALHSQWHDEVFFEQLSVNIQQVLVDTEAKTVGIEQIESSQGVWQVMWPLTVLSEQSANPATSYSNDGVTAEATSDKEATSSWQVTVDKISVADFQVELIDAEVDASLSFRIQSLEALKVNNIHQAFTVQSLLLFADDASLKINSEQVLSPLVLTADLDLMRMSLQQIAPWITDLTGLAVTEGKLTTEQQLKLNDGNINAVGSLTIINANINDQNALSMASWGELLIGATSLSSQDRVIVLDQITLDQAQGYISIDTEKNIEIQSLKANETSQKIKQISDAGDWRIIIGGINSKARPNKDTDSETTNPDGLENE